MAEKKQRLLALDILRGITIAGMITVNNPGSWGHIFAPLRHAAWNGCTPTDLVFPFFVFCMGVAMYISYRKYDFQLTAKTAWHAIYRGALIILIGWGLSWFGMALRHLCAGDGFLYSVVQYPIEHIRYLGVFPRLGIVSAMAALLLMAFKPKNTPWVILTLLAGYCILISVTNSFELNEENILSIVDLAVLGDAHMYHMGGIPFDPEGLLSTIPCIAHCLVGACVGMLLYNKDGICGKYIKGEEPDNWVKVNRVFIFSAISLMAGFLLDYAYPINKAMWSASYVLVTCGLAGLLLALLIWIIDIKGNKKWCVFFESFGVNPLFIFCLSAIFVYIMGVIKFDVAGKTYNVWSAWYRLCMQPLLGDNLGSLACALSLVFVLWLIAHPLYKKRIYIKI